jgi:hypothetical protein
MASFVDALRPEKFSGAHFKKWSIKLTNWLTTIKVFWAKDGLSEGNISDEDQRKFQEANQIFVGAVHNVLSDHLFDSTLHMTDAKTLGLFERYIRSFRCRQRAVHHGEIS